MWQPLAVTSCRCRCLCCKLLLQAVVVVGFCLLLLSKMQSSHPNIVCCLWPKQKAFTFLLLFLLPSSIICFCCPYSCNVTMRLWFVEFLVPWLRLPNCPWFLVVGTVWSEIRITQRLLGYRTCIKIEMNCCNTILFFSNYSLKRDIILM